MIIIIIHIFVKYSQKSWQSKYWVKCSSTVFGDFKFIDHTPCGVFDVYVIDQTTVFSSHLEFCKVVILQLHARKEV